MALQLQKTIAQGRTDGDGRGDFSASGARKWPAWPGNAQTTQRIYSMGASGGLWRRPLPVDPPRNVSVDW